MAPESSNATNPSTVISGQTVQVPRPDAGAELSVTSSPGGNLDLAFDPSTATTTRPEGSNDLVFELDGGGKVTISGFFEVGDNTLPNLTLPDGTVLASTDFFAGSDLDMTTAAGGGGAGAASGGTNYDDDPGALILGLDKYDKLGTDYWGRATENEEIYTGVYSPELPGGTIDISVTTDVRGIIYGGVFEDAQPFQHEGDRTDYLGKLNFTFTLTGTTVVTGLHITGFPAGTEIYIGEPPALFLTIGNDGDTLSLTAEQIAAGVYLRPPFDTDLDMLTLTSTADLMATSSGETATITGPTFTVIVDAAADKPLMDADAGFATPEQDGSIVISESQSASHVLRDGWAIDDFDKNTTTVITDPSSVRVTAVLDASIRFGDYTDGSETHYALVEVPSYGSWSVVATSPQGVVPADPAIITLYFDASGKCLGEEPTGDSASSKDYYQFEVPNSVLQESGGVLDLRLSFSSSNLGLTEDATIALDVGAKAVEGISDAGELWEGNNKSYTLLSEGGAGTGELPAMVIDTIDSQLHVRVGWASEDNDNSQHVPGSYTPDYQGMYDPYDGSGIDPNSTTENGAPIIFSISGAAGETMTSVKLYFDPNSGDILINGAAQTPAQDAGGWYVELTTANGGLSAGGLSTGNVLFSPSVVNSDIDVPMGYEVSVVSSAGASATYTGNTIVVIDAVADLPTGLSASTGEDALSGVGALGEEESQTIKDGWEMDSFGTNQQSTVITPIIFNVSATFPDTDGSETHYILISRPGNLSSDADWNYTSTPGLNYVGQYTHEGVTYDRFEVADPGLSTYNGQITVSTNTTLSADASYYIRTGAMAVENAENTYEYDLVNNIAVTIYPESLVYHADVVESGLNVQFGWASEDNNNAQHVDGEYTPNYAGMSDPHPTGGDVAGIDPNSTTENGAPIRFSLDQSTVQGSAEQISSITLHFTSNAGKIVIDGVEHDLTSDGQGGWSFTLTAENGGLATDGLGTADNVTFKPTDVDSDTDVSVRYDVIVENGPSNYTFTGTSTIVIDAVADKPVLSDSPFLMEIDGKTEAYGDMDEAGNKDGYEKANWGSVVRIQASAQFSDLDDDSETHYLLVEAREGWTCNNANGIVVGPDGVSYFYVLADPDSSGLATHDFELVAPSRPTGDIKDFTGDYATIAMGGGELALKVGGLAVEGEIATSASERGTVAANAAADAINVKGSDQGEYDLANNVAITTKPLVVPFNVVNAEAGMKTVDGYEDGRPEQHLYYDSDPQDTDNVYPKLNVSITTEELREDHIWGTKEGESEGTALTVTFEFAGTDLGTFHYNGHMYSLGKGVELDAKTGTYTLTIPADDLPKDADGKTALDAIVYKPHGNDDTDLTSVKVGVTVQGDNSVANTVIETDEGRLVVDAVADKPADLAIDFGYDDNEGNFQKGYEKDYKKDGEPVEDMQQALKPGESTTVSGSAVFNDSDGSEKHYIVVTLQNDAWSFGDGKGNSLDINLLSMENIDTHWRTVALGEYAGQTSSKPYEQFESTLTTVLTPGGNRDLYGDDPRYLLVEAVKEGDSWVVKFYAAASDGSLEHIKALDGFATYSESDNTLHYNVELIAPESLGPSGSDSATLYTKAVTVETFPETGGDLEITYANNISSVGVSGGSTAGSITVEVAGVTSYLTVAVNDVYEDGDGNKHVKGTDSDVTVLPTPGLITIQQLDQREGQDAKAEVVSTLTITYGIGEVELGANEAFNGVVQLHDAAKNSYDIPSGTELTFSYTIMPSGEVRYSAVSFPDPKDPGETITIEVPGADKTGGMNFNLFFANILKPVFVPGQDYSDRDVTVEISAEIVEPKSGETTAPKGEQVITVDAVADLPDAVAAADPVDYAKNSDGTEYAAARPGGSVTLSGTVTFHDLDGSEEHTILVTRPVGKTDNVGVVTKIVVTYVEDGETKTVEVSNPQLADSGYYEISDLPSDIASFQVAVTVQTSKDIKSDQTYSIQIGGRAEEIGLDGQGLEGKGASGGEFELDNNVAVQLTPIEYKVGVATGKVVFTPGKAFEGNDANQHLDTPPDTKDPNYVNPALATPFNISISGGANEYIAALYMKFDTNGEGIVQYTPAAGDPIPIPNGGVLLYFDDKGNCTNPEFAGLTLKGISAGSLRYVPDSASESDADIPIQWAATVVDKASGDTSVSTNIEGWSNSSDLGKQLLSNAPEAMEDKNDATIPVNEIDSTSSIIVDAVADKPFDPVFGDKAITYPSGDPSDKTTVAPGGEITIPVSVEFKDYLDLSEQHSFTVTFTDKATENPLDLKVFNETFDATTVGNAIKAAVDALTLINDGGDSYAGKTYELTTGNLKVSIVVDAEGNWSSSVKVETSVSLTVPADAGTTNIDVTVIATALEPVAEPAGTDGNQGITFDNNTATSTNTTTFTIDAVESAFAIKLVSNHVYENAQPEAFRGDTNVQGYEFQGQVQYSDELYKHGQVTQPLQIGDTLTNVKYYGAEIQVSGMDDNETAAITFTLKAASSTLDLLTLKVSDWGCITDANGTVQGTFTLVDGNWICTIPNYTGSEPLYFVPGVNYSSDNLYLDWSATVTDNSSGAVWVFDHDPTDPKQSMEVIVDAVAQQVEDLAVVGLGVTGATTYTDESDPKAVIDRTFVSKTFDMKVSGVFTDNDGSEIHYFLIEKTDDTRLSDALLKALGFVNNEGKADDSLVTVHIDGEHVYYRLGVSALKAEGFITMEGNNGEVTVATIQLTTTLGNGGKDEIRSGAMTVETNIDGEHGFYSNRLGNIEEDISLTNINNVSVDYNPPVGIEVALATGAATAADGETYEDGGVKDAHLGGSTAEYAELKLDFSSLGTGDVVRDAKVDGVVVQGAITVTYDKDFGTVVWYDAAKKEYVELPTKPVEGSDTLVTLVVSQEQAESGNLMFKPVANYTHSDTDTVITYDYVVEDTRSGDTNPTTTTQDIIIDAVAQRPDEVDGTDGTMTWREGGRGQSIDVSVLFTDWDTATDHYILIEAPADWALFVGGKEVTDKVLGEDGKEYFAVPVDPDSVTVSNNSATASLKATLVPPKDLVGDTTIKGIVVEGNMPDELHYGGMSVDSANLADSGSEVTWHNNTAFNLSGTIDMNYRWGSGGGPVRFEVAPVFENDTPLAHLGDPYTHGGGEIDLSDNVWQNGGKLVFSGLGDGAITCNDQGVAITDNGNGTFTVTGGNSNTTLYFVPGPNYDDSDVRITLQSYDWRGRPQGWPLTTTVTVDAVAQLAENVSTDVIYNNDADAAAPKDTITVQVTATLYDLDGSTNHYVLVERLPGWEAEAKTIYIVDENGVGKTYFQFPVDTAGLSGDSATVTVDVTMKPPASGGTDSEAYSETDWQKAYPGLDQEDYKGMDEYGPMEVKVMSQEQGTPLSGNEFSTDNNTAITQAKNVTVWVSPVELKAGVSSAYIYESNEAGVSIKDSLPVEATITVKVEGGAWDTATSVVLKVGDVGGTFTYEDSKGATQVLTVVEGKITLSADQLVELFGTNDQTGESNLIGDAEGFKASGTITWKPDAYSNGDLRITVTVDGVDSKSEHSTAQAGSVNAYGNVDVDGVAWAPTEVSGGVVDAQTIQPGGSFQFQLQATFQDVGTQEEFFLIEYKAGWNYGSDTNYEKVYDSNNIQYLKIPVDHAVDGLITQDVGASFTDNNTGITYTLIAKGGSSEHPTVTVKAEVSMTAPNRAPTSDGDLQFKYGAMAEDHTDTDTNKNIVNDYAFSYAEASIIVPIGVVESTETKVDPSSYIKVGSGLEEGYATLDLGAMVTLGNNESITSATFKVPAGTALYVSNGSGGWSELTEYPAGALATLTDATKLANGGYALKTVNEHASGKFDLTDVTLTVQDVSGASKPFPGLSGSVIVYGTSSDSAIDSFEQGLTKDVALHQAEVTMTFKGDFDDTDNEAHSFYIKLPSDGSVSVKGLSSVQYDGETWYELKLSSATATTASATFVLKEGTADPQIQVMAVAKETGQWASPTDTANYSVPENVTIETAGLTYNLAPTSGTTTTPGVAPDISVVDFPTEGQTLNLITLGKFTDADKDTLTVTLVNDQSVTADSPAVFPVGSVGSLTVYANGTALLKGITADDVLSLNLAITVADPSMTTATGNVSLNLIEPINTGPEGVQSGIEQANQQITDQVLTGSLGALFTDAQNHEVTLTSVTLSNGSSKSVNFVEGTATIEALNGTLTLIQEVGGYSYTYRAATAALDVVDTFTFAAVDSKGAASTGNPTLEITFNGISESLEAGGTVDGTGFGWDLGVSITGAGSNVIYGGDGNDTITVMGEGSKVYGGDGIDIINVEGSGHMIYGGGDNDRITGSGTGHRIEGGAGDDYISVTGSAHTIMAGDGNDTIIGHGGSTLYGGQGSDRLEGGHGDTFAWSQGDLTQGATDTILNFALSKDALNLGDLLDSNGTISFNGSSLSLVLSDGSTSQNVTVQFAANDAEFQEFSSLYNLYDGNDADQQVLLGDLITKITTS